MIYNNIKLILRNLWSGKFYTLINILGLAIGITSIVWAFQDIRFSFGYDDFHPDGEHIFRIGTKREGSEIYNGYAPLPLAVFAKKEFASIKDAVRFEGAVFTVKGAQEESFNAWVHYTDPSFFDFFNFPLIKGSNDLKDRSAVLLTESESKKFFGDKEPLGQSLIFHAGDSIQQSFTVKGILKDPPMNSTIRFGMLTNYENYIKSDGKPLTNDDWSWMSLAVYIKLPNPADATRLAKDFEKYIPLVVNARKDIKPVQFKVVSLKQATRRSEMETNMWQAPDDSATYGPLVLAILILLSACLNFANTTVSRSNSRLKEMGVRKVLGGTKRQLILQQLMECSVIVVIAVLMSILMNMWWLPKFNSMFEGIVLSAHYLKDMTLLKFVIILPFVVTILAGIYPAFYISRYNATQIFRGGVKFGGSNLFSRILLGLQIIIAFITVTAGFAFSRNSAFQRDYDFGYNQKNIVGLQLNPAQYIAMRDAMSQMPGIEKIAGSRGHLGFDWRTLPVEAEGVKKDIKYLEVGEHYLDAMGLSLVQGKPFNEDNDADIKKNIIISQNLCAKYGWLPEQALGKIMTMDTVQYSVIGVCKDIYMGGFFNEVNPIVLAKGPVTRYRNLIVRADQSKLKSVYDQIKAKWTALYPLKPFSGFYQDEIAAEAQKVNNSIATIFFWFAIISVLLTATGMFALISLTVLKKMREIAIRRVVGATLQDVILVVNKSYFWIFIIASILGIFAGRSLTKLLMDLIFKVNIGVNTWTIFQSLLGICAIIILVLGIKIRQVTKMNPSKVLKSNQ